MQGMLKAVLAGLWIPLLALVVGCDTLHRSHFIVSPLASEPESALRRELREVVEETACVHWDAISDANVDQFNGPDYTDALVYSRVQQGSGIVELRMTVGHPFPVLGYRRLRSELDEALRREFGDRVSGPINGEYVLPPNPVATP